MRIATLQFAPKLGDIEGNIKRANELLKSGRRISLDGQTRQFGVGIDQLRPDLLVLPELALTGMLPGKVRGAYSACARFYLAFPSGPDMKMENLLTVISRIQLSFQGCNQTLP